ncbi:MAG: secondary thiamine-phosphate synthase enzyme YjbQ [Clostridium sp.]|jgi:secondary thiamine-phosphate synthase enzyme|nr:secondary thiamine-phosphate synthase enzyme YjbQ [Clostridium sp.]
MLYEYALQTPKQDFYSITAQVREAVRRSGVTDGIAIVFCPHTTAGVTINENADPDVVRDLLLGLDQAFPDRREFRHAEGNSAAHLKASAIGSSATVMVGGGRLILGTWQGVYFCEFDPPRSRKFYVKILGGEILGTLEPGETCPPQQ